MALTGIGPSFAEAGEPPSTVKSSSVKGPPVTFTNGICARSSCEPGKFADSTIRDRSWRTLSVVDEFTVVSPDHLDFGARVKNPS